MPEEHDWSEVQKNAELYDEDALKVLFDQATLCYADMLSSIKDIQARCLSFFQLKVTLLTGAVGFFVSQRSTISGMELDVEVTVLLFCLPLVFGINSLWRAIDAKDTYMQGQFPKEVLKHERLKDQKHKDVLIAETCTIQLKIDYMKNVQSEVACALNSALVCFIAAPLAGAIGCFIVPLLLPACLEVVVQEVVA